MNTVKKLPLAMAVVAALCPISVMAQEFTQEQIDAIVAKAVDKALADRQAKIDAAANKKVDVIFEGGGQRRASRSLAGRPGAEPHQRQRGKQGDPALLRQLG
ncbi:hypothetical protein [Klebsiella pneumoniae]|uniref:hypothetical protein n=1 Tax=Klebsiella pneumoniae TaxID=573 RepID=UPI003F1DE8A4